MRHRSANDLRNTLADYLITQGVNGKSALTGEPLSEKFASAIIETCLCWALPKQYILSALQARSIDTILGFSFGNRFETHGNRSPGPVNGRLAKLLLNYYHAIKKHNPEVNILAQWEISASLDKDIPADFLHSIEPEPDVVKDEVEYLSTRKIVARMGHHIQSNSRVLIAAHPDHLFRCFHIVTSQRSDLDINVVEHTQPESKEERQQWWQDWYDEQFGQLWTRTRYLYLLHDALWRLNHHRENATEIAREKQLWPDHTNAKGK